MRRNRLPVRFNVLVSLLMLSGLPGITGCQEFTPFPMATDFSLAGTRISPSTVLNPDITERLGLTVNQAMAPPFTSRFQQK